MRRRWLYTMGGVPLPEPIEITDDRWTQPVNPSRRSEAEIYGNLQATDGADLSTRKRYREYMQLHGLAHADDYKEHWQKKADERAKWYTAEGTERQNQERRADIGRVVYELENRRRR